jgi:serine/threonine protein kinase
VAELLSSALFAVPEDLAQLLSSILVYSPSARLTAAEALAHPALSCSEVPPFDPSKSWQQPEAARQAKLLQQQRMAVHAADRARARAQELASM